MQREFTNNNTGETFTGYVEATRRLYNDAKVLGWVDNKLPVPDAPNTFGKKAIIILGPPASGKSSLANPIARRYGAAIIDNDEAKKILPEFNNGVGSSAVHEESSDLMEIVFAKALEDNINMVIPKIGHNPESIKRIISKLKNNGYEVNLVGMDVTFLNARNRMFMRFVKTGRYIPHQYIKSVGENPMQTYRILKEEGVADGYTHIDNNNADPKAPKPIIEDTKNLLEGVDIQFRRGREEVSGANGQPRGPGENTESAVEFEKFLETQNKADEAVVNLEYGNLPEDIPGELQQPPKAQESFITEKDIDDAVEQVARDTDFENIADDEALSVDEIVDDQVVSRSYTGAQIKAELSQDQQMLDRLRGCVV